MDPITTAIVAALPALASTTVSDAVKSAYEGLKAVIRRKWGEAAPINKAIAAVEADPSSKAQAGVLAEKVAAVAATNDTDVMKELSALVTALKAHGLGGEAVATIQINISGGTQEGIIGANAVSAGTMNFGKN